MKFFFINYYLLLLLLFGGICGCSNTKYAPGFSKEGFERVRKGSTSVEVSEQIGEPLSIYRYPILNGKVLPSPVLTTWDEYIDNQASENDLFRLHYTAQMNSTSNYYYSCVEMHKGRVVRKTYHLITE